MPIVGGLMMGVVIRKEGDALVVAMHDTLPGIVLGVHVRFMFTATRSAISRLTVQG